MSTRPKIPETLIADVLFKSRRRCCLCAFLRNDDSIKRGQIVHLNKKPKDNSEDNLAFLCLEHHDEHDSQTSVSKGLTYKEVKRYRDLLYVRNDTVAVDKRKSQRKSRSNTNKKTATQIEQFFWLAQALVGWATSGMELSFKLFESQAKELSIEIPYTKNTVREDYLSESTELLRESILEKHGQIASDIFSIATLVALLPFSFDSQTDFRNGKAAIEMAVLKSFESTEALQVTTEFLNRLPCEIPRFVERIEGFKKELQRTFTTKQLPNQANSADAKSRAAD